MWTKLLFLCAPEGDAPTGGAPSATGTTTPTDPPSTGTTTTPADGSVEVTTKTGRVIPMAQTTIDKLKRDQLERGRKHERAELEKKAKSMGFDTVDEMWRAVERAKQQNRNGKRNGKRNNDRRQTGTTPTETPAGATTTGTTTPTGTTPAAKPNGARREERQNREMQERLDRERRQRINAEKRAVEAQRDTWAAEANGALQVQALRVGVKDPDYAIELLTRECTAKRAELNDDVAYDKWLTTFNEEEFFTGLKKTRPYLFEETIVQATTGTTKPTGAAPPPGSSQVTQAIANAGQKKASDMTKAEYDADLARRGLKAPSF